jgi:hypothetical protein
MQRAIAAVFVGGMLLASCGGSKSASAPTPVITASNVVVTLAQDGVLVGRTVQASAVATMSDGSTRAVTSGWQSDAPSVATVAPTGLVTGVGNGRATIYVIYEGRQGQAVVRTYPNYQGSWSGSYVLRGCSHSGTFASINFCGGLVGQTLPTTLSMTQSLDRVEGRFQLGQISFSTFVAPVEGDGSIAFGGTSSGDVTLDAQWRVSAAGQDGRLTGTLRQIWRMSGVIGQAQLDGELVTVTRSSSGLGVPADVPTTELRSIDQARAAMGLRR